MSTSRSDPFRQARDEMVARVRERDVRDERVLAAMGRVPRHALVPAADRARAYGPRPVPIGHGQTISAPYIVASMTELLGLEGTERVLEVGTGSGYQTAVLCELAGEVYSVEIVPPLAERARRRLAALGYRAHLRVGDGDEGWPEATPFDRCLVTAAAPRVPERLVAQLRVGGRMVLPLRRDGALYLSRLSRTPEGYTREDFYRVRFVPMTGAIERPEDRLEPR